ncbi:Potassium channel subfamily K member 12 [Chelonia mydas]|uniref:Potassium channel subfamily K member 12 n=1 Tax=Chelonia mydas TaxID=8469 RepID=M7AMG6_CHEMY|nr:Potassium channel subfamily K member 12 [Chelonia mydas]
MSSRRSQGCCCLSHFNKDNGRFLLLATLIAVYLAAGATVFSALERPSEVEAQHRWNRTLQNFSQIFNISMPELRDFLRSYEAAMAAGIRADAIDLESLTSRPRGVGSTAAAPPSTLLLPLALVEFQSRQQSDRGSIYHVYSSRDKLIPDRSITTRRSGG